MLVPLSVLRRWVVCFFKSFNLELLLLQCFLFLIQKTYFLLSLQIGDQRQELLALPMETQADHASQEPQSLLESGME